MEGGTGAPDGNINSCGPFCIKLFEHKPFQKQKAAKLRRLSPAGSTEASPRDLISATPSVHPLGTLPNRWLRRNRVRSGGQNFPESSFLQSSRCRLDELINSVYTSYWTSNSLTCEGHLFRVQRSPHLSRQLSTLLPPTLSDSEDEPLSEEIFWVRPMQAEPQWAIWERANFMDF